MNPPVVFGLGQCSLDHIGRIDNYPPPDTKCEFAGLTVQGGGPVATGLVALSRWGVPCAFTGVVGDDAVGKDIRRSIESEGVDASRLEVRHGASSQFAFVLAEPSTGRRTIFWQRPTGRPLDPGEVDIPTLTRSRLLYTDGFFPDASIAAAREARRAGIMVLVDGGSLRDGMLELARLADSFVVSEGFARSLTGGDDAEGACRRLAELGPSVVGVTLGSAGYAARVLGQTIRRPAHHARVTDTTGCGDVFHAGLALGMLRGWPPERGIDFGAWAAARVAEHIGGRTGIPSVDLYPGWTDVGNPSDREDRNA